MSPAQELETGLPEPGSRQMNRMTFPSALYNSGAYLSIMQQAGD